MGLLGGMKLKAIQNYKESEDKMKKFRMAYQVVENKKNQVNFRLKNGITWEQVEQAKSDGNFIFEDYFEKVEG